MSVRRSTIPDQRSAATDDGVPLVPADQKLSASAYSLTIAVPSEGFAIAQGEPVVGGMHGPHRQLYCPRCKNWMFTHPQGMDFFVNVRATMLDRHDWYMPFVEVFTAEKLPWATTLAVHRRMLGARGETARVRTMCVLRAGSGNHGPGLCPSRGSFCLEKLDFQLDFESQKCPSHGPILKT